MVKKMRILETLTDTQKLTILQGGVDGIFTNMFLENDPLYQYREALCLGYYFEHSGSKNTSLFVRRVYEMLTDNPNAIIGDYIRSKFIEKWNKIYLTIMTEYDPLDSYVRNISKEGDNTESITFGKKISRTHDNTEQITYNNTVTDNTKESQDVTTTNTDMSNDSVYGFNSSTAVPQSMGSDTSSQRTTADLNKNVTENTQMKSGNDTTTLEGTSVDSHSGTDRKTNEYTDTETMSGRDDNATTLIEKELEFRIKYNLFNIIFNDIDSVTALKIY